MNWKVITAIVVISAVVCVLVTYTQKKMAEKKASSNSPAKTANS